MLQGYIFDLDGVIVSTDHYHYLAWQKMADKEDIPFDETINNRLRGISRMASLEIILENTKKPYTNEEKIALATYKNDYYRKLLQEISKDDILPDVIDVLKTLKERNKKIAVGSSSKNAKLILKNIGLIDMFDAIADGNDIEHSKPAPDVFLIAADKLQLKPDVCIVIEDAIAGIDAAKNANMLAFAVGDAINNPKADFKSSHLKDLIAL